MGQQQLLLVILVTIIVGIATVVAINIFGTSAVQANQDAVRQDMVTIAAAAQGWYIKPAVLGGGNNSFATLEFDKIQFGCDGTATFTDGVDNCENLNGRYIIQQKDETSMTLIARPSSNEPDDDDVFSVVVTRNSIGNISALGQAPTIPEVTP